MKIPDSILLLLDRSTEKIQIKKCLGGSINSNYLIKSGSHALFLKINDKIKYPKMFLREADGLNFISKHVLTPQILKVEEDNEQQFLALEWLEKVPPDTEMEKEAGRNIARLHQETNTKFGFKESGYIGNLLQENTFEENYYDFFIGRRIEPMLKIAFEKFGKDVLSMKQINSFFKHLPQLIPLEKPALIHGDLWAGNLIYTKQGAKFIDPASHYGHRESDIAMTKLFGGFSDSFYQAYEEEFPLVKDWEKRCGFFNLYPLLVHLILFGKSYHNPIKKIFQPF